LTESIYSPDIGVSDKLSVSSDILYEISSDTSFDEYLGSFELHMLLAAEVTVIAVYRYTFNSV
jgi:hypothetical protein